MKTFNLTTLLMLMSVILPYSLAASCENIIRLADLQEIIKNPTKLIQDQREIIQSLTTGEIVPWETVLDNVGKGYDGTTHKFIAPLAGTYQFTLTVVNSVAGYAYLSLVVGGNTVCTALAAGDNHQIGVCTHILQLTTGQEVWTVNSGSIAAHYNGGSTAFAGFVLRAYI